MFVIPAHFISNHAYCIHTTLLTRAGGVVGGWEGEGRGGEGRGGEGRGGGKEVGLNDTMFCIQVQSSTNRSWRSGVFVEGAEGANYGDITCD